MEILQTVLAGLGLVVTTVLLVLTFRQRGQTGEALRRLEDRLDTLEEAAGRQRSEEAAERSRMKMELADSVGRSTERMAKVLLDEFRGGKLGRFTLELPPEQGGEKETR